jgi:hypothetical protein
MDISLKGLGVYNLLLPDINQFFAQRTAPWPSDGPGYPCDIGV